LALPGDRHAVVRSLATTSPYAGGRKVTDVSLLGYQGKLEWSQNDQGLRIELPANAPVKHALGFRIKGVLSP
jgi:alpha-L-fucosidase